MACMLRHITLHLDALRPEVNRQISPDAVAFMNRSATAWELAHSSCGTVDSLYGSGVEPRFSGCGSRMGTARFFRLTSQTRSYGSFVSCTSRDRAFPVRVTGAARN